MQSLSLDELKNWDVSSRREWLHTNGIGGYSSSSVSGAHTRRYHGLLVAAFSPPLGRAVLLSKLDEEVRVEDQLYLLSSNKYPSVVMPQGYRHLAYFGTRPVPTFTYVFHEDTVVLEKRIWMDYGKNTVFVQYTLVKAPEPVKLGLVPLMAYKDYHTEQHRWDGFHGTVTPEADGRHKFVAFDTAHPIWMGVDSPFNFKPDAGWFFNFEHGREQERGLDYSEDLYCPGRFDGTMSVGQSVAFYATVENGDIEDAKQSLDTVTKRQNELLNLAGLRPDDMGCRAMLTVAADQFVIPKAERVSRATVIAGYHWFTDWGRDTMISLPGLCLSTGRPGVARDILMSFANAVKDGLLPNRFSDQGSGAEYNTVDATLWFFNAVYLYTLAAPNDTSIVSGLYATLADVITHHETGTLFGIKVDPSDGLLAAGEPGVQLTWMDAKVGDWVVTPRNGKPVEVNALWYNALCIMAKFCEALGKKAEAQTYSQKAAAVKSAFVSTFCNPETKALYDVIGRDGKPDKSVRPNQLFALSLPFPLLEGAEATPILQEVRELLLTPVGLRTLAPPAPGYQGHYGPGNQSVRDASYHEGTVWPWLMGAYLDSEIRAGMDPAEARTIAEALVTHSSCGYGMGTINEINNGDSPYEPNGCIAQAWSVSEALRILTEIERLSHKK